MSIEQSPVRIAAHRGGAVVPLWLLIAGWTLLLLGLVGWSAYQTHQSEFRTATTVALDNFNKDLVYRRWAAKQGGVYVPISEEIPPNPHLSTVPERDISTPAGRRLTLVNPAYMTRKVHELGKTQYGIKAHITSLKPLRPENDPDGWEADALRRFEEGSTEVVSMELLDGESFLRFMRPLRTEAACLKCHAHQGYREGDVRGGISVSVPWAPYRESIIRRVVFDSTVFFFIWSLGVAGLVIWRANLRRFLAERERVDQDLRAERDRAQKSEELLRESQLIAGLGSYVLDIPAGSWRSSEVLDRIFGLDEGYERTVAGWAELVDPDDRTMVLDHLRDGVIGQGRPFDKEYRIVRRNDQAQRWVHGLGRLELDAQGCPLFMKGTIQDITDSVLADKAVAASEEKYRTLFEESRDVIYLSTPAGAFIDINRAGVALLGYPSQEALKAVAIRDLYLHPEDRSRLLGHLEESGYVEDFKTVFVRLDRQQVHISISATAVRDASGKMIAIRGIVRDITENQKLEAQLRQSQKMESIGTLAGGVAHDFNNILTTISGYGHLILMKMAPDDPHRMSLQHILEASERAAHLTGDLLLFSRKQPINRKPVDLNEGIRRLSKFLVRVIGEDIAFRTELTAGPIQVLADEHQISQVLMNLAANARDAMHGGGVFTIATETVLLDEQFVASHDFGKPGRYALITAADTGTGMDEQTRQRIFEPFFTTKDPGKGTGLGMAVVYGIVKQHDGLVMVYSEPGRGSTFRVYLPVTAAEAGEAREQDTERLVGGAETILLAEDDRAVREMTLLLLRDYGYTVIAAIDGEDAVRKFRENQRSVQLLLFDLVMPKKTGKDAYDEIRRLQPEIKVVFSSGYDPDMVRQQSLLEMNLPLIRKPVEMAALLKLIRSVLDS